ncbi:hypothetical protein [Gordonia amicalis]|uniref:Uncharacterized protein n=1 Tax=Gordonia amicalis TaxID=89053 RepID=A0ABU4DJS3_9ACTN|nr:hypothetical protein [Gordonia amicalis]MDV6309999.1 hypothetical protein [Gordonia amicalis]
MSASPRQPGTGPRPLAYSALPEHDPTTRLQPPNAAFDEPAPYPASASPATPQWLTPEPARAFDDHDGRGEPDPPVRPGLFVGHPASFAAGVVVTAVAVAMTVWLAVYCANSVLTQIDPASDWFRPPVPTGEAVGWSVVGVLAAAALLLVLMATVEPPRTYYRWMMVLVTGVVMATVYTATGTIYWQHAIAPLVVVVIAAVSTSVGIRLVGSQRALRSLNQRTPIRPNVPVQRWQDHR